MGRNYQYNYSELKPSLYNRDRRVRKAETIVRVCRDFAGDACLGDLHVLDVGSSNGIIDDHLANHFGRVTGVDIDRPGIAHASTVFQRENLEFRYGDALALDFPDGCVDVVVCNQVYEHVPDARKLFDEIFRVLKPGGFCFFSGNNRLMLLEPHYHLPLLSVVPRPLAHCYLRLTGRGNHYHELHFTWWTLKRMCRSFTVVDYTTKVVAEPERFAVDYMLTRNSMRWRVAKTVARYARWALPMMWILHKPRQI